MRASWVYAIGALVFFVVGLEGGGWFFYGAAAVWAFHSFRLQRLAWLKEDRDRASNGANGEGGSQDGG